MTRAPAGSQYQTRESFDPTAEVDLAETPSTPETDMPLHPRIEQFLTWLREQGTPPLHRVGVPTARDLMPGLRAAQGDPEPVAGVVDLLVRGPAGRLPVRIYQPGGGDGGRPLVVFFHGGGWSYGSLELVDRPLRRLANATGAVIASVEYRLAPETCFPGPVEDAYAAVTALAAQAGALSADPHAVVVAGESAGANLAAAVALMARDRRGPRLHLQILMCPILAPAKGSRFASYHDYGQGYFITRDTLLTCWELYMSATEESDHPYAAPLLAPNLSKLPPALILTAEFDPVRDEGEEYGNRLRTVGVEARVHRHEGMIHGFFLLSGIPEAVNPAIEEIGVELRTRFPC
ncbi:alpha/beta hydrolase [Longimycelium tulufanense]|nr:alpha/beta hydrolase [Longimycelium tulufanense]